MNKKEALRSFWKQIQSKRILFLTAAMAGALIIFAVTTSGSSWQSGFGYRKSMTIQGSADGAQTNYQLKLTINKGTGADSGSTVYLNNHALSWAGTVPNDIFFTASDGVTALDYWIESSDANTATVWVEFNSIPVSPSTANFYIYYGKTSAASASNGANTFILFDDFDGSSLNTSIWNSSQGSVVVSGGKVTLTGPESYNYAAIVAGSYNYQYGSFRFKGTITQSQYYSYLLWGCCTASGYGRAGWTRVASTAKLYADTWIDGVNTSADLGNVGVGTEYVYDIQRTSSWTKYYRNTTLDATHVTIPYAGYPEFVIYGDASGNNDIFELQWAMLRKLTANEPTFGTWGSEETQPPGGGSSVTDTFTDSTKISASTNIVVTGGQVKLTLSTLDNGSACTAGSQCTSGYCYRDADADGYAVTSGDMVCKASASSGTDCYDSNANAKPGQTAYFTANRGDGSFDYNCSGANDADSSVCSGTACTMSGSPNCVGYESCTSGSYYTSCSAGAYNASCGQTWSNGSCATTSSVCPNYGCISIPGYGTGCGCASSYFGFQTVYYCNAASRTCSCR